MCYPELIKESRECERSCQRKWGTGGANRRCDCDGYRPDTLGGRLGVTWQALSSILATYVEPQFRELNFMQPMKKPALTIFLFFITACSKQIPYEQLVRRHDIYYEVNSTTPFSGTYVAHHKNGQLEREFSLKQGIPHGPYAIYYDNGQWQQKGNFKHGAEDGEEVRYYKNGQLWMESRYKEGEQVGRATSYYETGQLKYEFNYEKK